MQHVTESFQAQDGTRLSWQAWLPENIKAVLIIAHGYAEHGKRYAHFASFLVSHDIAVYALDHRGHGESEGERVNVASFAQFVDDLYDFVQHVKASQSEHPLFLLGHSMGGAISARFALKHPDTLKGLLLSAPFLQNATEVPAVLLALSGVVSRFLPSVPTTKLDTALISRDEAVVKAYVEDPLIYSGGTKARLAREMLDAGPYVIENAKQLHLPLLVMHGSGDKIAHIEGSKSLYNTVSSTDKQFKSYEGFYHEILNELGKETVYEDILEWLEKHLL